MSTETTNLHLTLPIGTEYVLREDLNANFEILDAALPLSLPPELLVASPSNPASAIQTFLNASSGKRILFPRGVTFTLETNIALTGLTDIDVDFNGCTLKVPNSAGWSRKDIVYIQSSNGVTFRNFIIDGNKANNTLTDDWTGILLYRGSSNIRFENGYIHDCSDKGMVFGGGWGTGDLLNIKCNGMHFKDIGGAVVSSSVYSSASSTSDITFTNTFVEQTSFAVTNENQAFYIYSGNFIIDGLVTKNNRLPIDVRTGNTIVNNLVADTCVNLFTVQPQDNLSTTFADVKLTNIVGKNVKGRQVSGEGLCGAWVLACESLYVENLSIDMDGTQTYANYGIWFYRIYSNCAIRNCFMNNVEITGANSAGIYYSGVLNTSTTIKNIKVIGYSTSCYGFYPETTLTAVQYIENYELSNCNATRVHGSGAKDYIMFRNNLVSSAPASATAVGYKGDYYVDASYYYYCYGYSLWRRIAGGSW